MSMKIVELKREGWRDAAKTLRKIADDLDAGEHPECTVGALTLIVAKGEVTVFGTRPQVRRPAMPRCDAPGRAEAD